MKGKRINLRIALLLLLAMALAFTGALIILQRTEKNQLTTERIRAEALLSEKLLLQKESEMLQEAYAELAKTQAGLMLKIDSLEFLLGKVAGTPLFKDGSDTVLESASHLETGTYLFHLSDGKSQVGSVRLTVK